MVTAAGNLLTPDSLYSSTLGSLNTFIEDDEALGVVYTAPSLVPNYNPGLRVYEVDRTNFNLVDYKQYYFDIAQANTGAHEDLTSLWFLEYSAKEAFNLMDLSPSSWKSYYGELVGDKTALQVTVLYQLLRLQATRH